MEAKLFYPKDPNVSISKNRSSKKRLEIQNKRRSFLAKESENKPEPLWQDGWLDNAGYWPTNYINSFQGNYLVPPNPADDSSQVLFYFIGAENLVNGQNLSIVQPVLTWGNGINGWSFMSWNCCPSGQAHNSGPLTGFSAGDTLSGSVYQANGDWNIVSSWNGQQVTLAVTINGRTFNWADVTLETYNVRACTEFPVGPMTFSSMVLELIDGTQPAPAWAPSGATECNGAMTVTSPSQISIQHNI